MPPRLALILCLGFVLYVLVRDIRKRPNVTSDIWVPLIWIMIVGSRPIGLWLSPTLETVSVDAFEAGSTMNKVFFTALLLIGIFILTRRKIQWVNIIRQNIYIFFFLSYSALSILWSDFPAIAFKRWIRLLGAVLMILIILTQADPKEALRAVFIRCAYVLIPFSILLIKYYRHLGVSYNNWTGEASLAGVTTDKNALGRLCLVAGMFFVWEFLALKDKKVLFLDKKELMIRILMTILIIWLLIISNSATSLVTFAIGVFVIIALGLRPIRKNIKNITFIFILSLVILIIFEYAFNLSEIVVTGLGRNMTFTDRIYIWEDLLNMGTDPLIGVGFGSFWLGGRLKEFWGLGWEGIAEAHNGYLEIYLELGITGFCLITAVILSSYRNITRKLVSAFENARFELAFLLVFLIYNFTESAFREASLLFFVFLCVGIDCEGVEGYRV